MKFYNPSIRKTDYIKLWCIQILIIQICSMGERMNKQQYRAYLRKQIREAKRKYYDHIFSLYKIDIKY